MKKRTINIPLDDYYAGVLYAILDCYIHKLDLELESSDELLLATDLLSTRMNDAMEILKLIEGTVEANR